MHGPLLHGFALLLTLGDRRRAAWLASRAMAAGAPRAADLRHPERAAAWLRARVLREARRAGGPPNVTADRTLALAQLGVSTWAADALGLLSISERAAIIVGVIEGLDAGDMATVLGRSPAEARGVLREARARYLAAASHGLQAVAADALPGGQIARRVQEGAAGVIGQRPAMAGGGAS